ncbi:hypothetical protein [Aureimonas sp. D3]|uniref:hypothetical protein n=1 Tax=Aureimonas sp. D3 TaxID=1638164 RepID=UPI0007855103|nr:hypothetical protein [Aureimonas sp. D3]
MSDVDDKQAASSAAETAPEAPTLGEVLPLDGGAMENPAFVRHKRGRNWCAILSGPNAARMERTFLHTRGATVDLSDVRPGQVIEFGGDYVTSGGNRHYDRRYFLVLATDGADEMTVERHDTAAQALRAARELAKGLPVIPPAATAAAAAPVL